jgi:hypothetical protein
MFTAFPQFSKLDITQKDSYGEAISKYPSSSDLSFSTLMIWWDLDNALSVSHLNDNLVFSYNAPGDMRNSGLSLVGTDRVDETIETIFHEMQRVMFEPRLVHVPDFVVDKIVHRENFEIIEELDYDEYVFETKNLYPIQNIAERNTRWKITKFEREAGGEEHISISTLDLEREENQQLIFDTYKKWPTKTASKSDVDWEFQAIHKSVTQSKELGIGNKCLFIDGEMCGFVLYQISADRQYMILNHLKVNYDIPHVFMYVVYMCARWATLVEIPKINLEMDLGIPGLRFFKSHIAPYEFLKKYTITPKTVQI